ncbi:MAG: ABC transporter permease [Bryobacterales bacterium]|nr:ABC transporter permease [Bryobacterales bacterium]
MLNDLRFALRMIASHAWFSAAIVVTLALGIGVNTTVFTLVNGVLYKPVALPGGERLVAVHGQNQKEARNNRMGVSYPDYLAFKSQSKSFEGLETIVQRQAILSETSNPPARFRMGLVSWGMFDMVHTPPVLGRGFTAADDRPGAEPVAIIGYRVWQNRYGGAREVVGRVVRVNGQPATIVGVMPPGFRCPSGQDVWMPLAQREQEQDRGRRNADVYGVLREGVSREQASADLALVAKRLATAHAATNENIGVSVRTFHETFNGGNIRTIFLLMLGAVGFVLLIACANVANMMLARSLARRREFSVRTAMGASRWQLIRQLLLESVLLSLAGGLIGLVIARTGVHYFDLATAEERPYWIGFGLDYMVFGYFAVISIGSGLLFGLAPAFRASRVDLTNELKEGARTAGNVRGGRLASALVVFQFALTVVLLSGAGLVMRSFLTSQSLNAFIPAARIFTARISLPDGKGEPYAERTARQRFYDELLKKLATLPGVTHAALSASLPGGGAGERSIEIEGKPNVSGASALRATWVVHAPGYQKLIGLDMQAGREFEHLDGDPGREAALATRAFASRHWPGQDAMGKRFRFLEDDKPGPWMTVVGVTADMVQSPQRSDELPMVFIPHRQMGWGAMFVMLRAAAGTDPSALARPAQALVQELDQDLPVSEVLTLDEALGKQRWMLLVFGALFFSFAAIGLVIASVGIYAVVAQAAARRTREIGIRMALGATARAIMGMTLGRGAQQLGLGLVLGLAGALAVTRLMKDLLFRVSPQDPAVFVSVTALLLVVGLFACWLPARRAAALHPVQALREE